MGGFRSWFKLLVYRFTVSAKELSMARDDRKSMNDIRRKFIEVEKRMCIYESRGGSCSEIGGNGVSLTFMGFKVFAFRPVDNKVKTERINNTNKNTVIHLDRYRTKH